MVFTPSPPPPYSGSFGNDCAPWWGGEGGEVRKHNRTTEPGLNEPKQFLCSRNFPMHSVIIEPIQQLALYVVVDFPHGNLLKGKLHEISNIGEACILTFTHRV